MGTVSSDCTVVMAAFNGAKYLAEQLASLEGQVMSPCRLIVSDDGSSDATREILASFAKEASFDVVILDGPQRGFAENFWSAAKLVDTKYLAWADQDDVLAPTQDFALCTSFGGDGCILREPLSVCCRRRTSSTRSISA